MKDLTVMSDANALLRRDYKGRAVSAPSGLIHSHVFATLYGELENQSSVVDKPVYNGELEKLFFHPLAEAALSTYKADYTPGDITKTFYLKGIAMALIAEYLTLTQAKDISLALSLEMVAQSPIYLAIVDAGMLTKPTKAPATDPKTGKKKELAGKDKSDKILSDLQYYISGATPKEALDSFIKAATGGEFPEQAVQDSMAHVYAILCQSAAKGKGFPLARVRRSLIMDDRATIMSAISKLWTETETTEMTQSKYDALVLAYAYSFYLQLEADYDVSFPVAPFQMQTTAWAQHLRSTASKMASLWSKVAVAPFSMDISIAIKLWESELEYFREFLPTTSKTDDLLRLWGQYSATFAALKNHDFDKLVDSGYATITKCYDADYILPPQYKDILDLVKPEIATEDIMSLFDVILPSPSREYTYDQKHELVIQFEASAGSVQMAIEFYNQALGIMSLNFQPEHSFIDITRPLTPRSLPVVGTAAEPQAFQFANIDPISVVMLKYKVISSEGGKFLKSEWVHRGSLLTPMFLSDLRIEALPNEPLALWEPTRPIPLSTVMSTPFLPQPLPAVYTVSRNRVMLTYDITTYEDMLDGTPYGVSNSEVMARAAAIFDTTDMSFINAITNAMSAIGLWYKQTDKGWEMLTPSVPTIYGVPQKAFLSKQLTPEDALDKSHATTRLVGTTTSTYLFVMHAKYPTLMKQATITWSPTHGLDLQIRLNLEDYTSLVKVDSKAPSESTVRALPAESSTYTNDESWVYPGGLFPKNILFPHILFDVWIPNTTRMTELIEDKSFFVSKRLHPVTKSLLLKGFYQNMIIILDRTDWISAIAAPDPIPASPVSSSAEDVSSPVEGKDPLRAIPALSGAPPKSFVSTSEESARQMASKVSTAIIPDRTDNNPPSSEKRLSGTDGVNFDTIAEPPKLDNPLIPGETPVMGAPLDTAPESSDSSATAHSTDAVKKKKYKKQDPKTKKWVYASFGPDEDIPAGFVPAEDGGDDE